MEGLLDGLKVVDLSSVLAGPLTGSFLAECGATVLKVEGPNGDVTRTWRVANEPRNRTSAYHAAANTGKQWVTCNLKTPEGRKWLHEALFDADVLIQNMKWRDLAVMELLPHTLREQFPQLVHVRLIGSEFDPDRLAYDVVVQAESGFMSMNGHSDRPPARLPVALMDVLASHARGCSWRAVRRAQLELATTPKSVCSERVSQHWQIRRPMFSSMARCPSDRAQTTPTLLLTETC